MPPPLLIALRRANRLLFFIIGFACRVLFYVKSAVCVWTRYGAHTARVCAERCYIVRLLARSLFHKYCGKDCVEVEDARLHEAARPLHRERTRRRFYTPRGDALYRVRVVRAVG